MANDQIEEVIKTMLSLTNYDGLKNEAQDSDSFDSEIDEAEGSFS